MSVFQGTGKELYDNCFKLFQMDPFHIETYKKTAADIVAYFKERGITITSEQAEGFMAEQQILAERFAKSYIDNERDYR